MTKPPRLVTDCAVCGDFPDVRGKRADATEVFLCNSCFKGWNAVLARKDAFECAVWAAKRARAAERRRLRSTQSLRNSRAGR